METGARSLLGGVAILLGARDGVGYLASSKGTGRIRSITAPASTSAAWPSLPLKRDTTDDDESEKDDDEQEEGHNAEPVGLGDALDAGTVAPPISPKISPPRLGQVGPPRVTSLNPT